MTGERTDGILHRALDAALKRALRAPDLPAGFHARLQLALARVPADEIDGASLAQLRQSLERDQRRQLIQLQEGYLRVRRRTLAVLISAAFAAGAGAAVAMPWIASRVGPNAPLLVAGIGASIGLAVAFGAWVVRPGVPMREFAIPAGTEGRQA